MEATRLYPNAVPLLAATGLGIAVSGNDPDHVPLVPTLINDHRRRFAVDGSAVDANGVVRIHVRNALGYAFLRPYHVNRLRRAHAGMRNSKESEWAAQASFYRHNYRHFVPHDLLMDFLAKECPPQEDGHTLLKWQGNAIAGADCGQDGHVVFYPTGQVLQQACAFYSRGESEKDVACSSTVVETGAAIRQFSVMGSKDAYHSTSAAKIFAVARGCTNCTIVAAPARVTSDNMRKMQAKAKISFTEVINHVAGSPHAEAEVALVTADGTVRWWDPEGGIQVADTSTTMRDRLLRCEYSSHPRVLWVVNRVSVSTLDLRQPAHHTSKLLDVASAGPYVTIYDIKRRASNPFQFVVGTGVSIELLDSRMARQHLLSWTQPESYSGESEFPLGAIDEVDMSGSGDDLRGYIVSSLKRSKVTTLFPFERNRKRRHDTILSLTSLRSNTDDEYSTSVRTSIEQLVASDATLDLHMEDGGEYTKLFGVCALRDERSSSASIYQLNSLGDLFSHRVSFGRSWAKSYHAAIQSDLPCGVAARAKSIDELIARTLPIPSDAILPEHDTESMQRFITLPIKVLRRQFPRLPENRDTSVEAQGTKEALLGNCMNKESGREDSRKTDAVGISRSQRQSRNDSDNRNAGKAESRSITKLRIKRSGGNRDGKADTMISKSTRSRLFDKDELVKRLVGICDPSTSLFRLHRYVFDVLKVEVSSTDLLQLLRSRSEFRIRMVHHALPADTLCVRNPSRPGADDVHCEKDDPRLASCTCRPGSSPMQLPCESWACVIPHAVIVSSSSMALHFDNTAPSSSPRQEMPVDLADIIVAAQAVYDDMYECP